MKAVVAAFNQEKALVGAFSVLPNLRMELFQALLLTPSVVQIFSWFCTNYLRCVIIRIDSNRWPAQSGHRTAARTLVLLLTCAVAARSSNKTYPKVPEDFAITEKARA